VPCIVEPDPWDAKIVECSTPPEPQQAAVVRLAALIARDMLTEPVPRAGGEAFFELAFTRLAQHVEDFIGARVRPAPAQRDSDLMGCGSQNPPPLAMAKLLVGASSTVAFDAELPSASVPGIGAQLWDHESMYDADKGIAGRHNYYAGMSVMQIDEWIVELRDQGFSQGQIARHFKQLGIVPATQQGISKALIRIAEGRMGVGSRG